MMKLENVRGFTGGCVENKWVGREGSKARRKTDDLGSSPMFRVK